MRRAVTGLAILALLAGGDAAGARTKKKKPETPARRAQESAESLRRVRQTLAEKKRKEEALRREIAQRAREERTVLAELDRRDRALALLRGEIRTFREEIEYVTAQLTAVRTRQRSTAGDLTQAHDALASLLRAWQAGAEDGLDREVAVRQGSAQAGRLSSARLSRFELQQSEARQTEYLSSLTRLRRGLADKERQLATARTRRGEFLSRVRLEKLQGEEERREFASQRRNLERQMDRILEEERERRRADGARARPSLPVPSTARVGQLLWPVRGRIARGYGGHKHAKFNAAVFSTGIEVLAAEGTPVRAAAAGRVVHADWLQGYGRVMIVDHGSGFYTLYGHLEDVRVSPGTPVERGAVLGTVGDIGTLGAPSLYFEVRQNGRAADPVPYLGRGGA